MRRSIPILLLALLGNTVIAAESGGDQPLFTMDENVWAVFYDVPSRRFRAIRDAFIRRDFQMAARDMETAIGFLRVEAERAIPELQTPLSEVIAQLESIRAQMGEPTTAVGHLDAAFARAHWLLSQHYLMLALQSRYEQRHGNAGRYLWATAHHLERAVLWSNARIDKDVVKSLESTRELAVRLQRSAQPDRVYRERPIRRMARTLIAVGDHLDRKVWIEELLEESSLSTPGGDPTGPDDGSQ